LVCILALTVLVLLVRVRSWNRRLADLENSNESRELLRGDIDRVLRTSDCLADSVQKRKRNRCAHTFRIHLSPESPEQPIIRTSPKSGVGPRPMRTSTPPQVNPKCIGATRASARPKALSVCFEVSENGPPPKKGQTLNLSRKGL
jgi:hypothetical protein